MRLSIQEGAQIIINRWLNLRKEESLLIVTDENHIVEAKALKDEAEAIGSFVIIMLIPISSPQSGKLVDDILKAVMQTDVVIGATTYSFVTTNAVKTALLRGSRFLSLPLSTKDNKSMLTYDFIRMNPDKSVEKAERIIPYLNSSKKIRVTTELGTDITFGIDERTAHYFTGVARNPSDFASSSFEVYIAPEEDKTNGTVFVDGAIGYVGKVEEPFKIKFSNGRINDIDTENYYALEFKKYMDTFECENINVAGEFGIGLNELSKTEGRCYIEDESVYKTFHIGLGRNISFGGKNYSKGHFDLIIKEPNIYVDDKLIISKGNIIV